MEIDKALVLTLEAAIVAQFFLSFIKGRCFIKDSGKILLIIRMSAGKQFIIILTFFGLVFYFIFIIIKGYYLFLTILIVIYFILMIYDFSKKRIITDIGFGQKSMYTKSIYSFTSWPDIIHWEWSKTRSEMLIFKYMKNNKVVTNDIDVPKKNREEVEGYFNKYVKLMTNNKPVQ